MLKQPVLVLFLAVVAGVLAFGADSEALPNFARKYNADCTMCHIQVPKLNRIGYNFRASGYRLPSEIGKEEKPFNLGDFFSARFQMKFTWLDKSPESGNDSTRSQLEFHEATFYPLAGSWAKYFGSLGEFSLAPGEEFEIENAYVRGVYGGEEGWFEGRVGIFHPFEGFGASDRPIGLSRPLFQTTTAVGSPFTDWGKDQMGLEVGYVYAKTGTSINVMLFNGINADGEPAQGGDLSKESGAPAENAKDFQVFINQFINDDSAISLYYYRGVVPFPETGTQTKDTYDRFAVYANYMLVQKLNLLAGYGYGHDDLSDDTVAGGSAVGNSQGFFGEADYHVMPNKLAVGFRYDQFDPSDELDHNDVSAETLVASYYILHGLELIGEYQHKETELTGGGSDKQDQIQARLIFIW